MTKNKFPNGITSYLETHHDVVTYLTSTVDNKGSLANTRMREKGTGGMYELAEELTDKFEHRYAGKNWVDDEYADDEYKESLFGFLLSIEV